ncbi:MAG: EAL domain-containing protein [Nitrospiraceae bacterium]|nr:EAL domain-containing protein [Nitrospiraceae bacterium]
MTHSFVRSWREWLLALPILGVTLLFLASSTPIFLLFIQNHLAKRTLSRDIRTIEELGFYAISLNRPVHAAFFSLLTKVGVPLEILSLEITESMVIKDSGRFFSVVAELHHQGIRISIDDFGTGATALSYLTSYPIAEVKIDRSLVTNLFSDLKRSELVRTIALEKRLDFTQRPKGRKARRNGATWKKTTVTGSRFFLPAASFLPKSWRPFSKNTSPIRRDYPLPG